MFGEKIMRLISITLSLVLIAATATAFPVRLYPGLDSLINQSPDIAIIRINTHTSGNGLTYDTFNVTLRHVFKGELTNDAVQDIALAHLPLVSTTNWIDSGFQPNAQYLVFLEPNTYTNVSPGTYRNLPTVGSCWKLLPERQWQANTNQPLHDQIYSLFDSQGWKIDNTEQAVPGYPPQGVGSPEP